MTGLEKILKAIEEDATTAANAVIAKATREAEEIIAKAKADADKKVDDIAKKAVAEKESLLSRAKSAAALQERKLILNEKQQIISNIISKAQNNLLNLNDKDYFEVIIRMVKKYSLPQPGKLIFNAKDKNRLPKEFDSEVKEALSNKVGASLSVAEETRNLDGGFILVYGDVEENCSFNALFSAAKEDLQDKVNSILFE